MFQRLSSSARRALGVGLALTAVTAATTKNVSHGVGIAIAMLLTVLAVTAMAQYGSRFERSRLER